MAVQINFITDPACPWSWGEEPRLRRLMWEFGEGIQFHWVMGGLARSYDDNYRDEEGGIGTGPHPFADLAAQWLEAAAATGMPLDPRLWSEAPLGSTYPASMAVKAAAEQGAGREYAYLRRLREGVMAGRRKLDHAEALVAEAGAAGLDADRFRIDLGSHAIVEAFGTDLDRARSVSEAAAADGAARVTEGKRRLRFPTALVADADGEPSALYGPQPYETYRDAVLARGAEPRETRRPTVLEAVERFGRLATREAEELTGAPAPVVRAELWALAREWRLRADPALTSEFWELA